MPRISLPTPRANLSASQIRMIAIIAVMAMMALSSASTFAQTPAPSMGILDGIGAAFQAKQKGWGDAISVYAKRLFWLLAVIDFSYLCATFVLDKKEMEDLLFSVLRKLMTLGFFFFVLKTSHDWIPQIIDTFKQIGQEAGGTTAGSPDGVAVAGYDAAIGVFQILKELKLSEQLVAVLPAVFMSLIIFLSFIWVSAQLLIAQVETTFAVGAGIILLGFGGSKWTTDMASKYMQYAVATGLKLMMLFLLVGTGQHLFEDIHLISGDEFLPSLLRTTGSAIMYGFLATKIPAIASAMMSGSPSLTAGDMAGAVLGAGAAIAGLGAAGMMASKAAGGAAVGSAAGATGVAKALSAGIDSGLDLGKSGAGLAMHAMGEAGSHGLGLAAGAIGDKVAGGAASFGQMVDQSAGGRVASSIHASRGGSMAGVGSQSDANASEAPSPSAGIPAVGNAASNANASPTSVSDSSSGAPQVAEASAPSTTAPISDQALASAGSGNAVSTSPTGDTIAGSASSAVAQAAGAGSPGADLAGRRNSAAGTPTAPLPVQSNGGTPSTSTMQVASTTASSGVAQSAGAGSAGAVLSDQGRRAAGAPAALIPEQSIVGSPNTSDMQGAATSATSAVAQAAGSSYPGADQSDRDSRAAGTSAVPVPAQSTSATPSPSSTQDVTKTAASAVTQAAGAGSSGADLSDRGGRAAGTSTVPVSAQSTGATPSPSNTQDVAKKAASAVAQAAGAGSSSADISDRGGRAAGTSAAQVPAQSTGSMPGPFAAQDSSKTGSSGPSLPPLSALAGSTTGLETNPDGIATDPLGDASTGAVTGGSGGKESPKNSGSNDPRRPPPLHEKIRDLKGYVPDDAAQAATVHIDLKHAE